jgi:tetratricopeptide (TPR) repeat protein
MRLGVVALGFAALLGACASDSPPRRTAVAERVPASQPAPVAIRVASAAGNFLAGSHAQRTRDFAAAASYFSEALSADRANRRLQRNTFLAMVASGRLPEAVPLARAIVEQDRGAPVANLSLVAEDVVRGDFVAAGKRLETLPRRGMNTFTAPLLYAWTLAAQGNIDGAIETLQPLSEIAGFAALRELHVALINEYGSRPEAAEAAYRTAAANRLSLRIVRGYGSFLERAGRAADARALYEKFLSDQPESDALDVALERAQGRRAVEATPLVSDPRQGMAEVFFNLAGTLAQSRSTDQSLIYGRFALYLRPDFPIAQLLVGGVLESLDRTLEALALYEKVDRGSALSWNARLRHAAGLDSLGRSDEAIAMLRAMASERTDQDDVMVRLGDILRAKKRYAESVDTYSEGIRRIGKLEERHWAILYARGIAFERLKRWQDAEKDLLRALELRPDQPYVLNYLGYSWVDQGMHLKRAQEMIERAVQLRPDDGYIVDSLGWVMYRVGKYAAATEQLERAAALRPDDPTINDHLGDAYWRVGRINEARFQWRRALTLDPEKEAIPEIERKIREGLGSPRHADGRRT